MKDKLDLLGVMILAATPFLALVGYVFAIWLFGG